MYDGLYFPIPKSLESFIVPASNNEIRLELHCDWIDTVPQSSGRLESKRHGLVSAKLFGAMAIPVSSLAMEDHPVDY
jgi:hypothetical protein